MAFGGCDSLTSVVIGNSITWIGDGAFRYCDSLTNVVIGNSVTSIGGSAFSGCEKITTVYYSGTASEWNNINIGGNNSYLTNTARYYYSESQPTTSGNYWHYDENGDVVEW